MLMRYTNLRFIIIIIIIFTVDVFDTREHGPCSLVPIHITRVHRVVCTTLYRWQDVDLRPCLLHVVKDGVGVFGPGLDLQVMALLRTSKLADVTEYWLCWALLKTLVA